MTLDQLIIFGLLISATILFVKEWIPYDATALLIVIVLMTTGILTPAEGLSGLASPATVTISAMLVISAALEKSGVLRHMVRAIEALSERHGGLVAQIVLMLIVGVGSAFMNNTAVVAVFIPVVLQLAPRLGRSASQLLMPMSFAAILGGLCTLIGTSTNLAVSSIAERNGLAPIGMFELLPLGAALFSLGLLYIVLARPLLPDHAPSQDLTESFAMEGFLTDLEVGGDFTERDAPLNLERVTDQLDLDVLEVFRDGEVLPTAAADTVWRSGDVLRVRGQASEIDRLRRRDDLSLATSPPWRDSDLSHGDRVLVEVVIAPDTQLVGRRVGSVNFPERFGAQVMALKRQGQLQHNVLGQWRLRGGDSLLLLAPRDQLEALNRSPMFVVTSQRDLGHRRSWRGWLTVGCLVGVIGVATSGLLPIVVAALLGCVALVISRCISTEEAYEAINWKVVMLLAGVMPLGTAMQKTGAATLIADTLLKPLGDLGPYPALLGLTLMTMLLTNTMTNLAAAAFLAPIAIQLAQSLGVEARPMLMAVTFGASLSFVTPIGYQTNTLIYEPGQYRFADYARFGVGLTLITLIVTVLLIPLIWPL